MAALLVATVALLGFIILNPNPAIELKLLP